MFITAVCVIFLIKLRWPKTKSLSLHTVVLKLPVVVKEEEEEHNFSF